MALITSHTLNSVDGSHAEGIGVSLLKVGSSTPIATSKTDSGGRLSLEISPEKLDDKATYELVFETRSYWHDRGLRGDNGIGEIVLRFAMPDASGQYHMPVILGPHSYSTWKSG